MYNYICTNEFHNYLCDKNYCEKRIIIDRNEINYRITKAIRVWTDKMNDNYNKKNILIEKKRKEFENNYSQTFFCHEFFRDYNGLSEKEVIKELINNDLKNDEEINKIEISDVCYNEIKKNGYNIRITSENNLELYNEINNAITHVLINDYYLCHLHGEIHYFNDPNTKQCELIVLEIHKNYPATTDNEAAILAHKKSNDLL